MTRFYSELGQNLALFSKYKVLAASPEYATLSAAQRRIIDNDDDAWRESLADACDDVVRDLAAVHEIWELIEALVAARDALDWIASNVDLPTRLLPQYRDLLRAADLAHRSVMERLDQCAHDEFDGLGYEAAWPTPEAPEPLSENPAPTQAAVEPMEDES